MNKLINLSDTHYIIVNDSEIKCGIDFCFDIETKDFYLSKGDVPNNPYVLKITHSTEPLESIINIRTKEQQDSGVLPSVVMVKTNTTKLLYLSEVEEAVYGYSVDKMAIESADKNSRITSDHWMGVRTGYHLGFKAHQELVKDKLFTLDDMRKAIYTAHSDGRLYTKAEKKQYTVEQYIDFLLQTLHPKTEWDVEFIDNKIKLV